jgi:SAM-dependent methyltransferase
MSATEHALGPAQLEAARKLQEETYAHADAAIWKFAVYDNIHRGWDLASLGGLSFLDGMIRESAISSDTRVLELGCGSGAACQYLANRTGCRATGVDVNSEQIARALRRRSATIAGSVNYVLGDIFEYSPADAATFDVVFQLDTFSLLPSMQRAVAATRRLVANEGLVYMADLAAGPNFTDEIAAAALRIDGFSSVCSNEQMTWLLEANAFSIQSSTDETDDAVRKISAILAKLKGPRSTLPAGLDSQVVDQWYELMAWYRDALVARALRYWRWVAKPQRARG